MVHMHQRRSVTTLPKLCHHPYSTWPGRSCATTDSHFKQRTVISACSRSLRSLALNPPNFDWAADIEAGPFHLPYLTHLNIYGSWASAGCDRLLGGSWTLPSLTHILTLSIGFRSYSLQTYPRVTYLEINYTVYLRSDELEKFIPALRTLSLSAEDYNYMWCSTCLEHPRLRNLVIDICRATDSEISWEGDKWQYLLEWCARMPDSLRSISVKRLPSLRSVTLRSHIAEVSESEGVVKEAMSHLRNAHVTMATEQIRPYAFDIYPA